MLCLLLDLDLGLSVLSGQLLVGLLGSHVSLEQDIVLLLEVLHLLGEALCRLHATLLFDVQVQVLDHLGLVVELLKEA